MSGGSRATSCASTEPEEAGDLARLTDSFHLNLTAFGFLAFIVGLFIVHASIGLAFEQRLGMIRTMRAVGVPLRLLMGVLVGEILLLALGAGVVGMICGYLIAAALLPDVAASLEGLYGASVGGRLALAPALVGVGARHGHARSVGGVGRGPAQSRAAACARSGAPGGVAPGPAQRSSGGRDCSLRRASSWRS